MKYSSNLPNVKQQPFRSATHSVMPFTLWPRQRRPLRSVCTKALNGVRLTLYCSLSSGMTIFRSFLYSRLDEIWWINVQKSMPELGGNHQYLASMSHQNFVIDSVIISEDKNRQFWRFWLISIFKDVCFQIFRCFFNKHSMYHNVNWGFLTFIVV